MTFFLSVHQLSYVALWLLFPVNHDIKNFPQGRLLDGYTGTHVFITGRVMLEHVIQCAKDNGNVDNIYL